MTTGITTANHSPRVFTDDEINPPLTSKRVPKYCLHRASQQAYVKLDGKRHYLGVYGSPESHSRYAEKNLRLAISPNGCPSGPESPPAVVYYWRHAKTHYVRKGQPSGHLHIVKNVLKYLNAECRDLLAAEFGPERLIRFRDSLIGLVHSRKYINDLVSVVKRSWFRGFPTSRRYSSVVSAG